MVGCGQGGALTKVPQAVLTGVDAHLQHVHQSKVIYLGQGPLQKSMKSHPWGLDSGHSLPVKSLPLAVGWDRWQTFPCPLYAALAMDGFGWWGMNTQDANRGSNCAWLVGPFAE